MSKEKSKNVKEIDKKNKKKKLTKKQKQQRMTKAIVIGLVGIMGLSTVAGVVTSIFPQKDASTKYNEDVTTAIEQAVEVENDTIEKIVQKQTEEKDYTLKTVLDIMGDNPAYIAEDSVVTYKEDKVDKLIEKYNNKKYDKNDFIELAWKTKDDHLVVTYLASDITDKVNVVGLFVNDLGLSSLAVGDNEKIAKTDKKLEDFADLNLTLEQFEEKVGKLYPYSIQYPLLAESEVVKANSQEDNAKSLIAQRMITTDNSTIIVYTKDNTIKSIDEVLNTYDALVKVDEETFKKLNDTKDLKEEDFLKMVEKAKLIGIEKAEHTHKEDESKEDHKDIIQTNYLIKNASGENYLVGFDNGVKSMLQAVN